MPAQLCPVPSGSTIHTPGSQGRPSNLPESLGLDRAFLCAQPIRSLHPTTTSQSASSDPVSPAAVTPGRWGAPSPKPARTSQPAVLTHLLGPPALSQGPPRRRWTRHQVLQWYWPPHVVTSHLYEVRPGPALPKPPGPWGLREGRAGPHQPP